MGQGLEVLVERAASVRGDPVVPRDFIVEAIERIESGEIDSSDEKYPTGALSIKFIYEEACKLFAAQTCHEP